jgi:uncharacterized membrane protein YebE (DUF533 family)
MSGERPTDDATHQELAAVLGAPDSAAHPPAPSRVPETLLLRFLARIAEADGKVHPSELAVLVQAAEGIGVPENEARRILEDELHTKSDCRRLAVELGTQKRRLSAYAAGALMASADGAIDPTEQAVLDEFAAGAGLSTKDCQWCLAIAREHLKPNRP